MRKFIRIIDTFNKALEALCGLALAAMTALIFLQVLLRFVLGKLHIPFSVPWTEELSRYLMIWAIFIGAAVIARRADALAVEALVQAVPAAVGRAIKFAAHTMTLAFYACIFMIGLDWAEFGLSESAPVLGMPMVYVYASMSVGASLTIINILTLLAEVWVEKKDILDVIDHEADEVVEEVERELARASQKA
jgi:TRAP-type C4-dicarboxylate transport system permease small subunit